MNKAIYIFTTLLITIQFVNGQNIPIPTNYSIVDTVTGDLDKDSIKELVVAYNTAPENGIEGVSRELIIYKLKDKKWTVWKASSQALYGSRDGGMMGDPFGQIEIQNGILLISQNGGSSWKWGFTDKYRFQDGEFYLIGYTSSDGKPCEQWRQVDFNLVTGNLVVKKEYEDCETKEQEIYKREYESLLKKGLKMSLQNRQEKEIKITTPKYGHDIYIAVGKE
ncbi:hypothetical protein [Salinimicrobium xinjiangense]|uniref:hypothetical protein n=1 Tax=Salinimicrobium xinjiangense TaxID=438596 RepID=UPI00041084DB|nr:hypothetical protein [Salinimicrobium xinjiangense]